MGIPRRTAHACAGWSDAIGRRAILEFIGSPSRYLGGVLPQSLRSSADDQPRAAAKLKRRLDELIHQLIATRPPDSVDLLGCRAVANTTAG